MDLAAECARSARHSIRHQNHQVWATSGRDTQSSWLLQWLACLVEIGEKASIAPDFLFFHCDLESQQHPQIFPSSYSQALLCLRYLAQQLAGLTAEEATSLTLRSMKTTLLAAGAQLHFAEQARGTMASPRQPAPLQPRRYARSAAPSKGASSAAGARLATAAQHG